MYIAALSQCLQNLVSFIAFYSTSVCSVYCEVASLLSAMTTVDQVNMIASSSIDVITYVNINVKSVNLHIHVHE